MIEKINAIFMEMQTNIENLRRQVEHSHLRNLQEENGFNDPGVGPTKAELLEWLTSEASRLLEISVEAREGGFSGRSEYFRGKSDGVRRVAKYLSSVEATT